MTPIIHETAGPIIKSDRTGRTRHSREYKQKVLAAFDSSSLSAPAFAHQCGIKYPTFASWLTKRRRPEERKLANTKASTFMIAELAEPAGGSSSGTLEVQLPGGAIARVADSGQLKLLAQLLRQLA
jgi:hypothetical protein